MLFSSIKIVSKFGINRFALILSKYSYKVKLNDILAGKIIGLESNYALVDIGLEKAAFLPLSEISNLNVNLLQDVININFIGEFLILSINQQTRQTIVSLKQANFIRLWERVKQMDFKNTIIYAKIIKSVNRGKILSFNGLSLFILNSYIPKYYRRKDSKNFLMPFKFIEIRDDIHITHMNCKLAVFRKLSQQVEMGIIYSSTVVSAKVFGIFINILGLQCLLHISEISKNRIQDISTLYKRGDHIEVKIIYKDIKEGKILGTIKRI